MQRGEIWDVELPRPTTGSGREQIGMRPALIVHSLPDNNNPLVLVVPFTTKTAALRFPHTMLINPSSINGLAVPSILLVFQLRALDRRRFRRQRGVIENNIGNKVDTLIRTLLNL